MNPAYDADMDSSNEMLVDPDDYVTEQPETEKDEVAIINPEQLDADVDMPDRIRADDYERMKEIVLPPLAEQPQVVEDVVNTWHIQSWGALTRREHGPIFEAGGHPWRILMFPSGNNVDYTSIYLEQGYEDGTLPPKFASCVQFGLVLWNPNDPTLYTHHTAHHRFTKEEGDWGFTRFVELRKLWGTPWDGSRRPLVENEEVKLTAYVRVVKDETGVLWHNFHSYDSKAETGYVGLNNQGATCYLNSLIQSLYFTNAFRKAVYQIPTENEETLTNSAYTLQRLFYQLQTSNKAVATNELTKSFGWETRHIFEQQDVQELSRKLMERMEEKMKGTDAENVLPKLFCGKLRTYISCINVNYESRRVEDFWDVQLNVSGNKDIIESFKDYIQVETMDGENQYFAGDQYKLQDANKGVVFESFPEVLNLQLKRFQYDVERDAMMKINDRYEFPETFDATPYLSEDADKSEPCIYQLHSVLVHSGDLNAGHYYAFIKPTKDGWFYKFDDDRVTKATMREVLEDNYGGEYLPPNVRQPSVQKAPPVMRQNSAYMLVYIRQTRVDEVLLSVTKDDTPAHLQKRLDDEAAEREARRKDREEAHLYLNVKVVTDDTFRAYGGTDLTSWDPKQDYDPSAPRTYRLLRKTTIQQLIEKIAEDTGSEAARMRVWCMVNRQNKTVRPDAPITDPELTIEQAHHKLSGSKSQDLRLWAELLEDTALETKVLTNSPGTNGATPKSDIIILFLKWFDVESQTISGVGHIYISRDKKVEDLVPEILKKMGWPEKLEGGERQQLKLFEEIKPAMIEPMKAKSTLKAAELQDGDIICFQKAPSSGARGSESKSSESEQESISHLTNKLAITDSKDRSTFSKVSSSQLDRIDDARVFYDFLLHRRLIKFYPHPRTATPEQDPFTLALSSMNDYDQVASKVGEKLDVDPTHLRFWTINVTTGNPKATAKRVHNLHTILNPPYSTFSTNNQRTDSLYYELLDMSLSELDTKLVVKIIWLSEGITKEELVEVLVPKSGTVNDAIAALIKKAKLDDEASAGPIRLFEVHGNKIHRELTREAPLSSVSDYTQVVAERCPKDELESDVGEFIYAYHFHHDPNKSHGVPFKFRVIEGEKFSETKKRLEKRTGIKGKHFDKIKFAVVKRQAYGKAVYLADDDVLLEVSSHEDDLLGLDHIDRTRVPKNGPDLFLK